VQCWTPVRCCIVFRERRVSSRHLVDERLSAPFSVSHVGPSALSSTNGYYRFHPISIAADVRSGGRVTTIMWTSGKGAEGVKFCRFYGDVLYQLVQRLWWLSEVCNACHSSSHVTDTAMAATEVIYKVLFVRCEVGATENVSYHAIIVTQNSPLMSNASVVGWRLTLPLWTISPVFIYFFFIQKSS